MTTPPIQSLMPLEDALAVFKHKGFDVQGMSQGQFKKVYFDLARKYHTNDDTHDQLATLNAAKESIMGLYEWAVEEGVRVRPAADPRHPDEAPPSQPADKAQLRDIYRAAMAEHQYLRTRNILDEVQRKRQAREATPINRVRSMLDRLLGRT